MASCVLDQLGETKARTPAQAHGKTVVPKHGWFALGWGDLVATLPAI